MKFQNPSLNFFLTDGRTNEQTNGRTRRNQYAPYFFKVGGIKSIMNKHKVKHHRNSDTKTGNIDHIRTTALERSVMNYWGA